VSRKPLLLETFEDRILCSASPNVTVSAPAKPLIGNKIPVTVTFDNASGTNAGFGPYVDLVLDHKTGVTGTGGGVDFVVGSDTATYLGQAVTVTKLTFQAADAAHPLGPYAIHPYADDSSGNPLTVYAPAGYGVGDTLLVLQLPFGSFTPTQPAATINLDLTVSNLAELNKSLGISARGGFQFGNDALDNPTTDPSIVGAYQNTNVTPALMTVTDTYLGPENETATGPNYVRQEEIDVSIAPGQTVANLQLSDLLPSDMQFVNATQVLVHGAATGAFTTTIAPSTTTPGGTLTETLTSGVTGAGTATPDASLIFSYYIPRVDASSAVIVNANSGAPNTAADSATASGQWNPIDTGDPQNVTATAGPATHALAVKSIATQETVADVIDTGAAGPTPGDTLEYTVQTQVSDYFALQNLIVDDIISDGQRIDPTFVPTITWTEHGQTFTTQVFQPADYTVTPHYSTPGDGNPNDGTDGTTDISFNVSGQLAANGQSPILLGGGIPAGGTGAGPLPNNPPLPFGPTTVTVKFRTVIQTDFSDNYPSGDAQLDPRDLLNSSVTASGGVVQANNATTPTGQTASDTSGASVTIVNSSVSKTIYAINGSTNLAPFIGSNGQYLLKPGDTVTYRLDYFLPSGSVENLDLTDYLPLPVFSATEVTTFDDVLSAAAPLAGHAQFGPNETLRAVHGSPPTISTDASANSLDFNYGTTDNPAGTAKTVDLLFTVTVGTQPFADGLFLTNQVQGEENNTQLPTAKITSDAIVQFQLQEPSVAIYKGVVGYNNTGLTLGGIAFTAPTAASNFTGTIDDATEAAAIGASDPTGAAGIEGGDAVRYAVVVQNVGRNDAFNVQFGDAVPAGYTIPAGVAAMNLTLRRGDGSLLVNGVDYTATLSAGGALSITLTDNYSSGNIGGDTETGALSRGFNADTGTAITNGSNTVVATYDLTLAPGVAQAGSTITNTASLTNYADSPGAPNFVPTPETASASVTLPRPTLTKALTGTQFNTTGNSNTQAVIGELVTYTLTLAVPDGTTPNAVLNDTMDPGLAFVDVQSVTLSSGLNSTNTVGTGTAPANVTVSGTGRNLAFNFGTLTNSDPGGAGQTITIVYDAVVLNENSDSKNATGNQSGVLLGNTASLSAQYTNVPAGGATPYTVSQSAAPGNVTVVEPALTLANRAGTSAGGPFVTSLTGVDGGDSVFYRVVITNAANGATAFNTTLSDALPSFLTGPAIQSVTGGGFTTADFAISGGSLQTASASGIDIAGGTTVTIIVQGTLSTAIPAEEILSDTARLQWTSLSGAPGQITSYNASSTERTGAGGPGTDAAVLNNYAVTSTATVTDARPVVDKRFAGGSALASDFSVPQAGTNPLGDVVVGESVLYDILVTLPEGVTQNLTVKDLVPAGMRLDTTYNGGAGYQIITTAAAGNGQLGADFSDPGALGTPTLTTLGGALGTDGVGGSLGFGNVAVTADNVTNNNSFLIRVRAIVDNVMANQAGTTLNNVAQIAFTNPNTGAGDTAADATPNDHTVTVIEPTLTILKTVSTPTGDAGDPVGYTITFSNPNVAGNADGYDVTLVDTLDDAVTSPNITGVSATGFGGTFTAPTAGDFQIVNVGGHNVLQLNPASTLNIPLGGSVTLNVSGTLANTVQSGQQINNTARTFWTSTPGTNADERTGSGVPNTTLGSPDPAQLNNYGAASSTVITNVAAPVVSSSIFATSESSTPDNFNTGLHDVAPGEIVTYRVTVSLPEGVTPNFSVVDAIPAGLAYVPGSVQLFPEHPTSPDPALNAGQVGTGGAAFNGSGLAAPTVTGAPFTNGAGVQFNFGTITTAGDNNINNNTFYFTYQAVVLDAPGNTGLQGAQTTGTNAVNYSVNGGSSAAALVDPSGNTTTLIEPHLGVNKTITINGGSSGDAGDAVNYTAVISHQSNSLAEAFNTTFSDPLPSQIATPSSFTVTDSVLGDISGLFDISGGVLETKPGQSFNLALGETVTVAFTSTLTSAVTPNETIDSTASIAYTGLPGVKTAPAYDPSPDVTTDHDRAYAAGDDAPVTVPVATLSKSLFTTSDANTGGSNVEIGETATYALKVTLPEGTTPNLSVVDSLPAGMQYIGSSVVTTAAASNGLLAEDFNGALPAPTVTGGASDGAAVTFSFGSTSVTGDNDTSNNSFLILVTARVMNDAGNVGTSPQTVLANTATLNVPVEGLPSSTTPPVDVTVVEPRLQIAKGVNDITPDIGETLHYTLAISHAANSTGMAYDVIVRDAMPAGMTLDTSSILVNGVAIASSPLVSAGSNNSTSGLIDFRLTSLALGNTVTVAYNATVAQTQSLAGMNLDNNARIYWDSQPTNNDNNSVLTGVPPGTPERDFGATPGYTEAPTPSPDDPGQDTQRVTVSAGAVTGTVYKDANANGVFDAGDAGIAGVSLTLAGTDLNGNAFSQTTTSGAGGAYSFNGLPAGVYTITETQPSAYTDGVETVGSNFGGTKSDALGSDTISGLTVASHSNLTGAGYNFGELTPSSVSGSVYSDVNDDGIRQGGEAGIAGVPVRLTGTDVFGQSVTLNGVSDASGNYTFNNGGVGLRPGTYAVTEVTQPAAFLDGKDTAGTSGGGNAVNDQISAIPLAEGAAATGYNFGELNPASLSGFVYQDLNNNGVRQAGESGIEGVAVTLTGTDDLGRAVSLADPTDASGAYSFTNLRPGTYAISETQPKGYTSGINAVGGGLSAPNNPGAVSGDTITGIAIANVSPGNNTGTEYDFGEIFSPQLTKSIVSSSEAFTAGNDVAVGETVRYRIVAQIPQSTFRDLVVSDLLPNGLLYLNDGTASYAFVSTNAGAITSTSLSTTGAAYVSGNETTVNTITPAALLPAANISSDILNTAQTYASGGNVYFHLGTVQNSGGESDEQFVVLEFNALVVNQASNQAGATLGNGAQVTFDTNNDGATTAADTPGKTLTQGAGPQAVVTEPNLTITKSVTTPANPVDAGDTITYQITVTNNAATVFGADAADAFNVRVRDILDPADLTLANVSVSGPGYAGVTNNSTGAGVDLTLSRLDVGDSATITVNATVLAGATAGSTIPNSATATYTSLPNAADAPGAAGSVTGERTGGDVASPVDNTPPANGAILNNYAVGASAAARTIGTPSIVKTLFSTSEAATTGGNLAIGETATYALTITLPEGITPNTSVVDALPAGLEYVSSAADFTGSGVTPFTLPSPTITGSNVTWNLGALTNAADNDTSNNSFTIFLTARAADVPGNVGGVTLRNDASLSYTNGTSGPAAVSTVPANDPVATIVEPNLQVAKSVDDPTPDINQTLHYTVTITNPVGPDAADGFNILVKDLIPSGLTLDASSIQINGVAIGSSPLVENNASTPNLLDLQLTQLAVGGTITVTYGATVNNTLANVGTTQDNSAQINWDSLAAVNGNERDYSAGPAASVVVVNTNAITGSVYDDNNSNGQFDAGDTGIGGVTLRLTGSSASGLPVDLTTTTAADGSYSFGSLPPGTYLITETQPAGYVDALETAGTTFGGATSDALNSNTITAVAIPAQSNATGPGYNFGETLPSSISGSAYLDTDNNGIRNVGETGLANVPITLTGTDVYGRTVTLSAATDANGNYAFTGLRPSNGAGYTVTEDESAYVPSTYLDGKATPGSLGGVSGGAAPNDNISGIVTPQGAASAANDFAELVPATLSGSVYVDANNNGVRNAGEAGIPNTTITLTGTDDHGAAVNRNTLTDAQGNFSFADLRPGEYTLTETQPAGYGDGLDALGTLGGTLGDDVLSNIGVTPGANGSGYTFGEKSASISGVVFLDSNANGVLDGGETGRLAGVQIQLLNSVNQVLATTTTAADGSYSFGSLTTGDYSVVETQPNGYGSSTPADMPVTVPTTGVAGVNFGATTGSLAGAVYFDADHSGSLDAGDSGISGVLLTLTGTDANGASVTRTASTDANGAFVFTNLLAGDYNISETQPANYISATNSAGTAGGAVSGDTIGGIALGAAQNANQYDFGETVSVPPGKGAIAGTVFLDANKNAAFNTGETGIGGVTLTLRDSLGNVLATTATDPNGAYSFGNLKPGDYTIDETQPPAYGSSTPNVLTPVSVAANGVAANENFGETYGSLSGFAYVDANNNGAKEAGETPIAGVTVTLTGTDVNGASVNRTAVTQADGSYVFNQLLTGVYTITETQPAQYANGKDALGTSGGALGTDVTSNIGLGGGIDATGYNFGELPASLTGRVFVDANKNGALDAGESGLGGVTLQLLDASNTVLATTTTAADGGYSFGGLAAGSYTVLETQPNGYGASTPDSLTVALPATGASNVNFGATTGSLAGRVYVDADNSGSFNAGDGNLAGVTVSLTGTDSNNNPVSLITTTGANGTYIFAGLVAGDYTVTASQPAGFTPASDNVGSAGGQNTAANTFTTIGLGGGVDATDYNFGQRLSTTPGTGAVSGVVFLDANKNGALDPGEAGVGGGVIELLDGGGAVLATTTADADGTYIFTNVAPGAVYQVTQAPAPTGYGTSTPATLSNITVAAGQAAANNNFGETTGSLAGNVYRDDNNDGVQDAGEPGLAGVVVTLTGTDANGTITPVTATTDANGHYQFTGLLSGGAYTITETQPAAYGDGQDRAGTAGGDATVPDVTSGVQITAAQDAAGYNFGELGGSVTGTVFSDLNKDGALEAGEPGIGAVPVELIDSHGVIVGTTTSAADGKYAFTGLAAGDYTVAETQPAAYGPNSPASVPLTVPAGGMNTANFAEITGSISGTVYHDRNNDGLIEAGEQPIAGVTITLSGQDSSGAAIAPQTTVSAADGSFTFTGLLAGTYTLTETQPAGFGEGRDTVGSAGGNPTVQDVISGIGLGGGAGVNGYLFGERIPSDLVVTKTDHVTSVVPGQVVKYTMTVNNASLQEADGVIVTDGFPKGELEFLSASHGGVYNAATGAITWLLGEMPTGDTVTLTVTARVINPAPAHAETITNTVTARDNGSSGPDLTPKNNTATDVDALHAAPDLYILKTENLAGAVTGKEITYTLTGGNAGDQVSTGVIVTDTLPPGLRFVSASNGGRADGNKVVWQAGTLKPGDTFRFTVTVVVTAVPGRELVTNAAAITDDVNAFEDPTPSNNKSSVGAILSPALTFGFDAFNNFSVGNQPRPAVVYYAGSPDVFRPAILPLAPIYSGEADPGSTLVISLYDSQGNDIGSQTVVVDSGGNWMATFPSTSMRDIPDSVQIVEQSAFYSLGDNGGFNLRAYFSPALNPGEFVLNTTGGEGGGGAPLLNGLGLENPLQLGSVKYGGELLSAQATAGGE